MDLAMTLSLYGLCPALGFPGPSYGEESLTHFLQYNSAIFPIMCLAIFRQLAGTYWIYVKFQKLYSQNICCHRHR